MKEEINRIIKLIPYLEKIEIIDDETVKDSGFNNVEDYKYIEEIKIKYDNFMKYVEDWEGLEDRKLTILRTFITIHILRKNNINV